MNKEIVRNDENSRASKVKDIICPDCFDKFGDGS